MAPTGVEMGERQSWIAAIVALAGLKGVVLTEAEFIQYGGPADSDPIEALRRVASRSGLRLDVLTATLDSVPDMLLPAIFEIDGDRTALVLQRGTDSVRVALPGFAAQQFIDLQGDALQAAA